MTKKIRVLFEKWKFPVQSPRHTDNNCVGAEIDAMKTKGVIRSLHREQEERFGGSWIDEVYGSSFNLTHGPCLGELKEYNVSY